MVTADEVLFVIVSGSVLLLPIGTDPKFRLPLPSSTEPTLFEPPARPWHPVSSNRPLAINEENGQATKQPITVHCDLGMPSPIPTAGDFGSPEPLNIRVSGNPVSLLVAASHRLRKAQLGAASGQDIQRLNPACGLNFGVRDDAASVLAVYSTRVGSVRVRRCFGQELKASAQGYAT